MGLNQLEGTPWHLEGFHRKEGDAKRHRSRCKYFMANLGECERRNGKCIGSAHCMEYKEISRYEQMTKKRSRSSEENEPLWYT